MSDNSDNGGGVAGDAGSEGVDTGSDNSGVENGAGPSGGFGDAFDANGGSYSADPGGNTVDATAAGPLDASQMSFSGAVTVGGAALAVGAGAVLGGISTGSPLGAVAGGAAGLAAGMMSHDVQADTAQAVSNAMAGIGQTLDAAPSAMAAMGPAGDPPNFAALPAAQQAPAMLAWDQVLHLGFVPN